MEVRRGTYILAVTLGEPLTVEVGALGVHSFAAGTYVYVGSAMGGLDQRLSRHLARSKKLRWHIDYLTTRCESSRAYESYPDFVPECGLAAIVRECGGISEMKGFGCSDCDCSSHLFKVSPEIIEKVVSRCGLVPFSSRERL